MIWVGFQAPGKAIRGFQDHAPLRRQPCLTESITTVVLTRSGSLQPSIPFHLLHFSLSPRLTCYDPRFVHNSHTRLSCNRTVHVRNSVSNPQSPNHCFCCAFALTRPAYPHHIGPFSRHLGAHATQPCLHFAILSIHLTPRCRLQKLRPASCNLGRKARQIHRRHPRRPQPSSPSYSRKTMNLRISPLKV